MNKIDRMKTQMLLVERHSLFSDAAHRSSIIPFILSKLRLAASINGIITAQSSTVKPTLMVTCQ